MPRYFKIMAADEIHNGFKYCDGLNILDKAFQAEGSCVPGGLYFTTIEHIPKYYSYGIYLREVYLPKSDSEFVMVCDPDGDKWRANKIILGQKHSLFDLETYDKFNLNISANNYIVDFASKYGKIEFLNWFKNNRKKLKYTNYSMDWASANGTIEVLNWWLKSGLTVKYTFNAMDDASANGNLYSLMWWRASGLKLRYSSWAIDYASRNAHINILNWWLASKLYLKYTNRAMDWAFCSEKINVLEWWIESKLYLKYTFPQNKDMLDNHPKMIMHWKKVSRLAESNFEKEDLIFF